MPAEDVPKNRGWFRKILTLGRGNPKDSEKPEPDAEPGDAGIEGKYHPAPRFSLSYFLDHDPIRCMLNTKQFLMIRIGLRNAPLEMLKKS